MSRIRVFDIGQKPTDRCIKLVSKSTAERWVSWNTHKWIEPKSVQAMTPAERHLAITSFPLVRIKPVIAEPLDIAEVPGLKAIGCTSSMPLAREANRWVAEQG